MTSFQQKKIARYAKNQECVTHEKEKCREQKLPIQLINKFNKVALL